METERLKQKHVIVAEKDGEEIEIWNFLNVRPAYQFWGGKTLKEEFPASHIIKTEGGVSTPEYVTEWVAEDIYQDLLINLDKDIYGIEVIDIENEDIKIL